jgi:two-component system, cell cycle sensor histidine kinase and response regulator CckA
MPQGGMLTIETANVELDETSASDNGEVPPGPHVMIVVRDNGQGMDADTRAHIFEPFFTTKERGRGTGLGLASVFGIVTQSGGHITVDSEVGRGTTFRIFLPRVAESVREKEGLPDDDRGPGGSETVLLVEDEDAVRELIAETLVSDGYRVLKARHGAEALLISEQHAGPLHLLLTDIVMPHMSGRELADRITPTRPDTKILFISGYTDDVIARHRISETDTYFLQKPFTPDTLARKVRQVLDADSEPAPLRIVDLGVGVPVRVPSEP